MEVTAIEQPNAAPSRKYLPALEALRGLAALLVASLHFAGLLYGEQVRDGTFDTEGFTFLFLTRAGPFGVEVFFFLSGFIMVYTTDSAKGAAAGFLLRRILRIMPLYWLCLAAYWVLITPASPPVEILKSAFLLPKVNSGPPFFGYSTLPVAWSLTYEMLFYAVFALAIRLSSRLLPVGMIVTLLLLSSVIGLQLWMGGSVTLVPSASPLLAGQGELQAIIGVLANPLFVHFVIGTLAGEMYKALGSHPDKVIGSRNALRAAIAILLIATPILYFAMPNRHGLLGIGASAFSMFVAFALTDLLGEPIKLRVAVWMGQWSYGIYLIHPIVFESISPGYWRTGSPVSSFLTYLAVTIALASLAHALVERPFINLARSLSRRLALPWQLSAAAK